MDLRKYWQKTWQKWRSKSTSDSSIDDEFDELSDQKTDSATNKTLDSLHQLLDDKHIPSSVRMQLGEEYQQVQQLVDKLENQQVHIVVFGKVSSGKSSLLNALLGQSTFATSPLHGETKAQKNINWDQYNDQNMVVIDTPGTDEVQGSQREHMAHEATEIADIILFVVDGDLTQSQLSQFKGNFTT